MNSDTLTLSRLRFFGHHGLLPGEILCGQNFEVTIQLELPLDEAGLNDDLSRTVDYRAVREVVRGVIEGPPRKLVEALAESVAAEILTAFPMVQAVEVEVVKPRPPVDFASSGLTVRIRRARRTAERPGNRETLKP
jgi:dihydroneopterin aldolase